MLVSGRFIKLYLKRSGRLEIGLLILQVIPNEIEGYPGHVRIAKWGKR